MHHLLSPVLLLSMEKILKINKKNFRKNLSFIKFSDDLRNLVNVVHKRPSICQDLIVLMNDLGIEFISHYLKTTHPLFKLFDFKKCNVCKVYDILYQCDLCLKFSCLKCSKENKVSPVICDTCITIKFQNVYLCFVEFLEGKISPSKFRFICKRVFDNHKNYEKELSNISMVKGYILDGVVEKDHPLRILMKIGNCSVCAKFHVLNYDVCIECYIEYFEKGNVYK